MLLSERTRGRWREILPALGISARYLVNKGGPCPVCGGKDRFRWDNKNEEGSFYCNQCGAGNGWILVRKFNKWDAATTSAEIERIIGSEHQQAPQTPIIYVEKPGAQRLVAIERLLEQARSPQVVNDYLAKRGLTVTSEILRGHKSLGYYEDGKKTGQYPAVIAPIMGGDGSLQSAQRIYVADIPDRKKTMPPVDTITGGAARLFDVLDELAVSEGIETALAVHEMYNLPTWATISANGLEAFVCPKTVRRLWIFGDNDESMTGQASAYALARRMAKAGIAVEVHIPLSPGQDWLDVLNNKSGVES